MGDVDLIFTGKQAIDGDTAQVGPGIAEFLKIPQAMFVTKVLEINDDTIHVRRVLEDGYEDVELPLPATISIVKGTTDPRLPSLRGMMKSKRATIPTISFDDLDLKAEEIGLTGSPTRVVKIFSPEQRTDGVKWEDEATEMAQKLVTNLHNDGILD